ncbi:JAB domain-containing protein [Desulfonatronospira thiodismutans]|uniref:JAB domain-containing protein n=1 Tax=Desulfonatronospira thiodismutans TaxID=488939 RepID=UPI0003124B9A|nr:JAB domain-containing protein [Desulfonatronospira thiodismutans]
MALTESKPDYFISNTETAVIPLLPYRKKKTEHFIALLVDNKNRLICKKVLTNGTVDQAPVFPREIVRLAIIKHASGIILGHNHPGGDPHPSSQDRDLTRRIERVCRDLGIRVLDHVIVSDRGHFSFLESGYL